MMGTALVAAYLLVLQALLGGLSAGTHAGARVTVDAFGQIICRGASAGTVNPDDPSRNPSDCCTTGCQTSASAGLPPPALRPLDTPFATTTRSQPLLRANVATTGFGHSPHNARAPPLA